MLRIIFVLLLILSLSCNAFAGLEISTDNRPLFFGLMQLGQARELAQLGAYHNQITCSSTNGNTWYLKISLLGPLSLGSKTIPLGNFKWQLVGTSGTGTVVNPYIDKDFSLVPDTVYISGTDEAAGTAVTFQFKYYLKIPDAQLSGVYNTTVRFTLMEI
jgi:hypothetical protein